MVEIGEWMKAFLQGLQETFAARVWFVGLQGSYGRGEATDGSDIDVVVILDELSATDMEAYGAMLDSLSDREKICGFISGKAELFCWEPSDLFQFYHDTIPIRGSLDELLLLIDSAAIDRAIRIGACNLYHGCVHNMLHRKSHKALRGLYKAASFVVQAIAFQRTGQYFRRQQDLREAVASEEREIVDTFLELKNGGDVRFDPMSQALFAWSKKWVEKMGGLALTDKEKVQ